MVKLNIVVEGGVSLNNVSANTANNVESLRQSLHKFFSKVLGRDDLEITIYMGSGFHMAAKMYIQGETSDCLYVDSDEPKTTIGQWYEKLVNPENPERTIIIPEERKPRIFFMVQEMEAWFLKQPECLNRWAIKEGYLRKKPNDPIENHSLIRGKNIEEISKPSEKLAILLRHYFEKKQPNTKKKMAQYGKLKTAPNLLDSIDTDSLIPLDTELQRFKATL